MNILELPREILIEILSYNQLPWTSCVCRELHHLEKEQYVIDWRKETLDVPWQRPLDVLLDREDVNWYNFVNIIHYVDDIVVDNYLDVIRFCLDNGKRETAITILLHYIDAQTQHYGIHDMIKGLLPYGDDDLILPLLEDVGEDDVQLIIANGWPSLIDEMLEMVIVPFDRLLYSLVVHGRNDLLQHYLSREKVDYSLFMQLATRAVKSNDEEMVEMILSLMKDQPKNRQLILDDLLRKARSPRIAQMLKDRGARPKYKFRKSSKKSVVRPVSSIQSIIDEIEIDFPYID